MKQLRILLSIGLIVMLTACATIINGRYQNVKINTEPQGAQVFVNGTNVNQVTPCKIKVKRKQPKSSINKKNELVYTFKKENYFEGEYKDGSKTSALSILDWWSYILPGLVDLATGANRVYSNEIDYRLNKANQEIIKIDTIVKKEIVYVDNGKSNAYQFEKKSDVDISIPSSRIVNNNRFALIMGNEDYSSHQVEMTSEINVDFARNDASAFKEYALNILGIPSSNIVFLLDATTGQMNQGISKLNLIAKNTKGNAELFVYYAGHGLPDEQTKDAYLMPVDVSGKNAKEGIKLNDLYAKLTEYPSKNITFFIDACFSGGARNQGLLAARGVKIKPTADVLSGNLVVFTASSGEQSSLPYKEKQHGLFTYFLLKKLQESKGEVNYKDLSDYIKDNVSLQSVLINEKEQSPQVNISNTMIDNWENLRFK